MDDERRKKIEAGKQKMAEYKKKKRKLIKNLKDNPEMPVTQIVDFNQNANNETSGSRSDILEEDKATSVLEDTLGETDLSNFPLIAEKMQKYPEMIQQRDMIIKQLASTIEIINAENSAKDLEAENLKKEFDLIRVQMQEISNSNILRQREKNESFIQEPFKIDLDKSSEGTQTEAAAKSTENISIQTSLSDNLKVESAFFEESENSKSADSESYLFRLNNLVREKSELQAKVVKLSNFLMCSKIKIPNESCDSDSIPSASTPLNRESEAYANTLLKKIVALNTVAKLVETLLNNSTSSFNNSIPDFSPSKFQRFFLKRMDSHEASESLVDISTISESENQASDINYAEVEVHSDNTPNQSILHSVERLRNIHLSEDFSGLTEFLRIERDNICSEVEASAELLRSSVDRECLSSEIVIEQLERNDCHKHQVPPVTESSKGSGKRIYEEILQERSKLEGHLKYFVQLEKSLQESERTERQKSVESDNLICSEDNLLMEQPALSCLSLLSLTDSECKTECFPSQADFTDSETSISRKVSYCAGDVIRSNQEKEKYEREVIILKTTLAHMEAEMEDKIQNFKVEKQNLILEKEAVVEDMSKQIELLCKENDMRLNHLTTQHDTEIEKLGHLNDKWQKEMEELSLKIKVLNEDLNVSNRSIKQIMQEKADVEFRLQNEIADLVQDHQQDLESLEKNKLDSFNQERKRLEREFLTSIELLKKVQQEEQDEFKHNFVKEYVEKENNLIVEHNESISRLETAHADDVREFQKKIEQLLEEKCNLLTKTSQDYEKILQKNHKTLVNLCTQLLSQIKEERERIKIDKPEQENLEASFSATLNNISLKIENGINKYLNVNYFVSSEEDFFEDETQYIELESKSTANSTLIEEQITNAILEQKNPTESQEKPDTSFTLEDIQKLHFEIIHLQEQYESDVETYKSVNQEISDKLQILKSRVSELEDQKEKLEQKLDEKEKILAEKDAQFASSSNHAAQTNSRLLHVLSDLVKMFLDIESDINSHLLEYGLIPSHSGNLGHHDEETGQNVGSREDFSSLCLGEGPTIDLTEDGPDLTPRAWDLFSTLGTYDVDTEGEDVVLGASRRLRLAVDHLLNLLTRVTENQQNHDLKVLLKRNEELSEELQQESQTRDSVHFELLNAKNTIRKYEMEKQKLEDLNLHLTESQSLMKKELCGERNKLSRLAEEKDSALDEIHMLKEQHEILASRLGDPEKKLLQENSKLSSEKQVIQKHHSKERQSLLDRLHQMELALDELTVEKNEILELKCKEIEDLKSEMESMEKQCQSNKKFIEEQTSEREQEREEFIKEINKLEEFVREKEKIQSNEGQLLKEIEASDQVLRSSIEDRKNAMTKKDEAEKELRQALEKIRDLRDVIDELERQLEKKSKSEDDLKQKLQKIHESVSAQEKNNLSLKERLEESKNVSEFNHESIEQLRNLEEQLASRSEEIEQMSQSQTLLHELRGQIHFLEAKVDQRARQLEASHLSMSPIHSDDTSQSDGEALHIPCEDGWEMSPRSVHWLEVRRLEEKIGRLMQIDEEFIKRNRELELQLRKIKEAEEENHHENVALQEKLSEQLIQISALKSHIDEQKHRTLIHHFGPSMNEIEELRKRFEFESEKKKRIALELQDTQDMLRNVQEQIKDKDNTISLLQQNSSLLSKKLSEEKNEGAYKALTVPKNEGGDSFSCIDLMILEKNEHIDSLTHELEDLKNQLNKLKDGDVKSSLLLALEESRAQLVVKEEAFREEQRHNRCLREENSSLRATIQAAEEQIELGKIQVETLLFEMGNFTKGSKRLNHDFNTVQDMVLQKERELEVLQEESDAQLKLESKLETLEQMLSDQKDVEQGLLQKVMNLETLIEDQRNSSKKESERFQVQMKELTAKHLSESNSFKKRIQILSRKLKSLLNEEAEAVDIANVRNQLVEAAEAFKCFDNESKEAYGELIYATLQKFVNNKLNELKKNHEGSINLLSETWEQKVKNEISTHEDALLKKHSKDLENTKADKDAFWQRKLNDIEISFQAKHENLSKSFQDSERTLDLLKTNVEDLAKENSALKKHNEDLKMKEQALLQRQKKEKDNFLKEFQMRLQSAEDQMKSKYHEQKQQLESSYKNQAERLQAELHSRLESKKSDLEARHKEELAAVHKFFEQRWTEEIKKFHMLQLEDIKKLKDNKEKDIETLCSHLFGVYEEKLKKIHDECEVQIVDERKVRYVEHQVELQNLQKALEDRFGKEKESLLVTKEAELRTIREELEKRYDKKLLEKREFFSLPENMDYEKQNWKAIWQKEKSELVDLHEKEMASLKFELERRYENQILSRLAARDAEMQKVEDAYSSQLEDARKLLKEAHRLASAGSQSRSSSVRTATPTSDITTSSDETCSSCREDILSSNKQNLVNKIHRDGKQVLSLIESRQKSETNRLLEEREWILNQLKDLPNIIQENESDIRQIIRQLVQEIKSSQKEIERISEKEIEIQQQYAQFRHQISVQSSKNHELVSHLISQKKINEELNTLLNMTKTELHELKQRTPTQNREHSSNTTNEKEYPFSLYGSGDTSRMCLSEVEAIRSADTQRSGNGFSMFLPEISSLQKMPENVQSNWRSVDRTISPMSLPSRLLDEKVSPIHAPQRSNEISSVQLNFRTPNGKNMDVTTEAKFHCLFWRYKRSQSYQKALMYQKKYLLSLLKGFQATEKVTLTWLNMMGNKSDSVNSDLPPRGKSLFRAASFAIIAVVRMKYLVRFWQQRARFPTSNIVNNEVESVLQNHPFMFPAADQFMSSNFSTSKSVSLEECDNQSRIYQSSTDSRVKEESQRKSSKVEANQLIEYVNRLETLHKQLGLQDILSVPLLSPSTSTSGS